MPEGLTIRNITLADLDALEDLFPAPVRTSYLMQILRQSAKGYSYVGVFKDHRPIAVAHIRRQGPYDPVIKRTTDRPELGNLYVLEGYRGRGVAKLLVTHLLSILVSEKHQSVGLVVAENNSGARYLYERLGFKLETLALSPNKAGVKRLYYRKNLE